jgi:leucyl aminopeptidase
MPSERPEEVSGLQFRTVSSLDGEQLDAVIVPVFKEGDASASTPADLKQIAEWVARESGPAKLFTANTHLASNGDSGLRLVVIAAGRKDEFDVQRAWQVVAAGVKALWQSTARRIAVVTETYRLDNDTAVSSAVEGVTYAMWRPEAYRTGPDERRLPPLEEVLLLSTEFEDGGDTAAAIARGEAVGAAVNWARVLSNEPANLMTPTIVAERARALASESGLQIDVLDEVTCRDLGMGSYLSVARGSDEPAQFIVMRHHGRGGDGYDLGLVGKGITFDSGGISLKDPSDMHLMKYDMSGASAVLATASVVARLNLPLNLIAVAPCTENLPGGHATKPGDVFTSMSGKTVEVINTDAEGRLVLIDGVTYAQREGATRVVDVATLTGAIMIALGRHYSGLFGRPEGFVEAVRTAGNDAGERLWPMPLSDEYRDDVKSEIADIRNSVGARWGGAIMGAAFVEAAIDAETEWAHLDIASTAWFDEDRPFSPKGPQGTTVRTLVQLAATIAGRTS